MLLIILVEFQCQENTIETISFRQIFQKMLLACLSWYPAPQHPKLSNYYTRNAEEKINKPKDMRED